MPASNRTAEFKDLLKDKAGSPGLTARKSQTLTHWGGEDATMSKEYMKEAYNILSHIDTLTKMLANIRRPYLSIDSRNPPLSRHGSRNIDLNSSGQSFSNIKHLTNEERDQIDLQARVILTRCADRVKEMEVLEKRRAELVASRSNPLARLLPVRLRHNQDNGISDFIAAHRSSVTWYLSRRLTEASQRQKEMQEERVKRQLERTKTLGSGAAREASLLGVSDFAPPPSKGNGWLGEASSNLLAATIGAPSGSMTQTPVANPPDTSFISDDEDDDIELSSSQIMQFETENANILREVQDTLESVQQAEARLVDISALQMELITHLTRQTELTDQLYEDAIATTSMVEKGNEQLRDAKRRAKDSRLFILLFLIGASLSLLFLHFY